MDFALYDDIACLDHEKGRVFLFSSIAIDSKSKPDAGKIYESQKLKLARLNEEFRKTPYDSTLMVSVSNHERRCAGSLILRQAQDERPLVLSLAKDQDERGTCVDTNASREREINRAPDPGEGGNRYWFTQSVLKIKEWIAQGDIYQANLSQKIESKLIGTGLDFFSRLRTINPSPYSCYLRFGAYEIASSSPELLIKKQKELVETRPIAGTRPRGKDPACDRKLMGELLLSEKERAEHIMLVDLERNDLGRVCRSGSVKVTRRMTIEKYSHVMHIVSHVQGKLRNGEDIFRALEAVFPGGTITGCPKVRCMEILDEIEPAARGPFFGSAGWIGWQGDAEMNILIRTAVIQELAVRGSRFAVGKKTSKIYIQAGSGIVADSDPEREYEESLHKARALLEALGRD
jgi:para-aminobenzoate synthetase component 1